MNKIDSSQVFYNIFTNLGLWGKLEGKETFWISINIELTILCSIHPWLSSNTKTHINHYLLWVILTQTLLIFSIQTFSAWNYLFTITFINVWAMWQLKLNKTKNSVFSCSITFHMLNGHMGLITIILDSAEMQFFYNCKKFYWPEFSRQRSLEKTFSPWSLHPHYQGLVLCIWKTAGKLLNRTEK